MGHTTDFVGHVDISPPLNEAESAYLSAFRHTRHCDWGGSPYDVPGNPLAPERDLPIERRNNVTPGMPGFWCNWVSCGEGCCLSFDGSEKFYDSEEWLRYLIGHLLAPGAVASVLAHPQLAEFTFDHRLDGIIVGCRRDNRELFALVVEDNRVTRELMRPGDPMWDNAPPLAYQEAIDREQDRRRSRRQDSPAARARGVLADVVVLDRRR